MTIVLASGWLLFQETEHFGLEAQLAACPTLLGQSPPTTRVASGLALSSRKRGT